MKLIPVIAKSVRTHSGETLYEMLPQQRIDLRDFIAGLLLTCEQLVVDDSDMAELLVSTRGMPRGSSVNRQGGTGSQTRQDVCIGLVDKLNQAYDMSQRQLDLCARTINPLIKRLNQCHNYDVPLFGYTIQTLSTANQLAKDTAAQARTQLFQQTKKR